MALDRADNERIAALEARLEGHSSRLEELGRIPEQFGRLAGSIDQLVKANTACEKRIDRQARKILRLERAAANGQAPVIVGAGTGITFMQLVTAISLIVVPVVVAILTSHG